jgi:hypothetical protein
MDAKVPLKFRWAQFVHARRIPNILLPQATVTPTIKEGVYHYENRSVLPFDEMISKAERSVESSAITFAILTISNYNTLKGILSRKVHITFLILNPESSSILTQSRIYHGSEDLKEQIQKSLGILCGLKKMFNDLVEIRFYDSISANSIVIVDRDRPDNAWIQVESRPVGSDAGSRPIRTAYGKDNPSFYNMHLSEYDQLLKQSKMYECRSTIF